MASHPSGEQTSHPADWIQLMPEQDTIKLMKVPELERTPVQVVNAARLRWWYGTPTDSTSQNVDGGVRFTVSWQQPRCAVITERTVTNSVLDELLRREQLQRLDWSISPPKEGIVSTAYPSLYSPEIAQGATESDIKQPSTFVSMMPNERFIDKFHNPALLLRSGGFRKDIQIMKEGGDGVFPVSFVQL